ncbi:short neuropeptide F [Calliopsis andreniformis]|uniref:short neuropeptide F n=1 Tax=Calliopsis andreniformis TaxID=337506 RepID=UPI003FCE5F08
MSAKSYIKFILLLTVIVVVAGTENYLDYGDEVPEKSPAQNIRELYRLLLERSALDNRGFGEVPLEHLMIRKSQRSPSLRLRFGRSDPRLSVGGLSRSMNGAPFMRFDEN